MYRLIGVMRRDGDYNGMRYDNHYIHLACDDATPALVMGAQTMVKKVATRDYPLVMDAACKAGDTVHVEFDFRGNLVRITPAQK